MARAPWFVWPVPLVLRRQDAEIPVTRIVPLAIELATVESRHA